MGAAIPVPFGGAPAWPGASRARTGPAWVGPSAIIATARRAARSTGSPARGAGSWRNASGALAGRSELKWEGDMSVSHTAGATIANGFMEGRAPWAA